MSDATVSGLQVISASTTSTSISLQWTHQNNRNYTIRYSTLSNFSSFESVQSNDTETTTISGLSSSTQYYFRIAIKFTNYTGIFSSDVISGTTLAAQVSQGTLSLSFITNHDVQLINSNVSIIDGKRTFVFSAAGSGFLYITGLRFSDITNIPNETVVRITNTSLNTLYFRDKTWAMGGTWSSEQYSFNFGSYQQKQIGQDQSLDLTYSQGEQNWV